MLTTACNYCCAGVTSTYQDDHVLYILFTLYTLFASKNYQTCYVLRKAQLPSSSNYLRNSICILSPPLGWPIHLCEMKSRVWEVENFSHYNVKKLKQSYPISGIIDNANVLYHNCLSKILLIIKFNFNFSLQSKWRERIKSPFSQYSDFDHSHNYSCRHSSLSLLTGVNISAAFPLSEEKWRKSSEVREINM